MIEISPEKANGVALLSEPGTDICTLSRWDKKASGYFPPVESAQPLSNFSNLRYRHHSQTGDYLLSRAKIHIALP